MPDPATSRAIAAALLLTLVLPSPASAVNPAGTLAEDGILVAVLDSGLDLTHPEFAGRHDRVVAWWDFGTPGGSLPAPGQAWDPRPGPHGLSRPFDTLGHGTAVASLVAGAHLGTFPDARLAVARLDTGAGTFTHLAPAIRWATGIGADVVVMSWSVREPAPGALDGVDDAVRALHEAGGLAVVSAGNGALNVGVRATSLTQAPSSSPYALVVGAEGAAFSNNDPDVVAAGVGVCVARLDGRAGEADDAAACTGRYRRADGTSYSAPKVAGWAGAAWEAALDAGRDPGAVDVRRAVLHTARDTSMPFAVEGWGRVDASTAAAAEAALVAGAAPAPNSPGNAASADLTRTFRTVWTEDVESGTSLYVPRASATPGEVGASAAAFRDADVYALDLEAGEAVEVTLSWAAAGRDLDLLVRAPWGASSLLADDEDLLAASETPGVPERVAFVAPVSGVYRVYVEGWLAAGPVPYTIDVRADGAPASPAFLGDHARLATRVLG